MAFVKLTVARKEYICKSCSKTIRKSHPYYRIEPHPMARYHRGEEVQHICQSCAGGRLNPWGEVDNPQELVRPKQKLVFGQNPYQQTTLNLDENSDTVEPEVHIVSISEQLIAKIITNPHEIYNITPSLFEELICDRLYKMGFQVEQVGGNTFRKDGGVDIVACNHNLSFPLLMAIQVKHHKSPKYKTGPDAVRDLLGVIQYTGFNAGAIVTNTTFTPDAKWVAQQKPTLLRLRDLNDIKKWLLDEQLDGFYWQEVPDFIEICPGVTIQIPKPRLK